MIQSRSPDPESVASNTESSFAAAVSGGSESKMPACAFTT